MKEETPLEHWSRKTENTERFLRHKSFCKYILNKSIQTFVKVYKENNMDVSQIQQKCDDIMRYYDSLDFLEDFNYLIQKRINSDGQQTPFDIFVNTKRPCVNGGIGYNHNFITKLVTNAEEDYANNLKTLAINKPELDSFAITMMENADLLKQIIRAFRNGKFIHVAPDFIKQCLDYFEYNDFSSTNEIKYIHYYFGGLMTYLKRYKNSEEKAHKDIQDIIELYERHPEYGRDFNEAAKYFSSLDLKKDDLDLLVTNYFLSAIGSLSELSLPPLDFGPDCESLPLYGGIFIDGNEEQISNVKDVIQNSDKRIKAQFYKCISDTNKKLKKEIEKIFYELCKKEYMDCNIDNLYIFTYILTKYTPFGKKIDMRPIFWGKSEEDGNGTLKIRDKDRAVLYYFFAIAFKEIDGSKQSRLQNTKSLFCLDHSDPDHPIDEEVSDSEFPVYKGHPHRYIAYNDYSRIPSDMVKVINDFAKNINSLRNQCFDKLKKLSPQK